MKKKNLLKNDAVQSLLASLGCIVFGLLVGYVVLLFIQPKGAGKAILTIIENFFTYNRAETQMKYLGSTLVKTAPLLMCSLSILFAYKVGLFNIGAAGQYVVGSCASLYAALAWGWSWLPCMLLAIAAGMAAGAIVGLLKTFCNVNEVISGIMLNWIFLYATNMILTNVKEVASPYTYQMHSAAQQALLPSLGLDKLFSGNQYVTIAIPLAILMAILVWVVLEKTRFGYELKATGFNKHAAKYCGMAERRNTVLTLAIAGGLAALGGSLLYQTGYEQWQCTHSSVPNMGFNGICAAFLGGLNPIGAIFSSFFIQHITSGGAYVDKSLYCSQISDLITSIIIYMCGFVLFLKTAMNNAAARREERQRLAMGELEIPEKNLYRDHQSGKDFDRPQYRKLVRRLKRDDVLYIKSIDRLGRNYREILEQWRGLTKEKGGDIVVLDMPLLDTRRGKDLMGTFLSDIVLQVLSFVAENERAAIHQRQAEGIAAAKARGVRFGRPPRPLPENFPAVHRAWRSKKLTLKQAAKACEMPVGTFYSKAVQWETTAALPPGLDL